jgi:hypothetical protein
LDAALAEHLREITGIRNPPPFVGFQERGKRN